MKINDIALLLTAFNINKNKLIVEIDNYKKELKKRNEIEEKQKEFYLINYEQKRTNFDLLYKEFIQNRRLLYNKWASTNKIDDLIQLVNYKYPDIDDIPDIYTIDIKKSKLK